MLRLEAEYVLIGTGLAPLVAARRLHAEGKSVLVLNPDPDFFLEDSEWPLDPVHPCSSEPQQVHQILQSEYPGSMELWPKADADGFHDLQAPHVRARSRLLMWESGKINEGFQKKSEAWKHEAEIAGVKLRECDGLTALRRFPGASQKSRADLVEGLLLAGSCDVDVSRYRNGVHEFVRERMGPNHFHVSVSGIEISPGKIGFRSGEHVVQNQGVKKIFMFWTPRVAAWAAPWLRQIPGIAPAKPINYKYWEKWSLRSRDFVLHDCIAVFDDLTVWAESPGTPPANGSQWISVLRTESSSGAPRWASDASFQVLSRLFHDLLGWDRFSVRSLKTGIWFDSSDPPGVYRKEWIGKSTSLEWVGGVEGPIHQVVGAAKNLSEMVLAT